MAVAVIPDNPFQLDNVIVVLAVVDHIDACSLSATASLCQIWKAPSVARFDAANEGEFVVAIPCLAARQQLLRLLGAPSKPAQASMGWMRRASKRAQRMEMMQSFTHRSICAAKLEGADIFAACKRAMLFSDEPAESGIAREEVERWMCCIVEAVDSGHFEDSVQAWRWFAEHEVLQDGSARWLLELAHSLGNLGAAAPLIAEYPALRKQVEAYAVLLEANPNLGQYTTYPNRRLAAKDVKRLLERAFRTRT